MKMKGKGKDAPIVDVHPSQVENMKAKGYSLVEKGDDKPVTEGKKDGDILRS